MNTSGKLSAHPGIAQEYPSFISRLDHVFWNGLLVMSKWGYEALTTAGPFVITGLALKILVPSVSPPFFAMGLSLLGTRIVVNILGQYNSDQLKLIKTEAIKISSRYPNLQAIAFIFAVTISIVSPLLGFTIALATGIFGGILIEIRLAEKKQQMSKPYEIKSVSNSKDKLVLT